MTIWEINIHLPNVNLERIREIQRSAKKEKHRFLHALRFTRLVEMEN